MRIDVEILFLHLRLTGAEPVFGSDSLLSSGRAIFYFL